MIFVVKIVSNPHWLRQLWWSKNMSMLDRGKLPLGADVEAVLSLSLLILKLEMQGSQPLTWHYAELQWRSKEKSMIALTVSNMTM